VTFRRNILPQSSGSKPSKKPTSSKLNIFLRTKRRATQKAAFFTVTAVRTYNSINVLIYSLGKAFRITSHLQWPSAKCCLSYHLQCIMNSASVAMSRYPRSQTIIADTATACGLNGQGVWVPFQVRARDFPLHRTSRRGQGPTQLPIQRIQGAVSRGVKLTTRLHLVPRSGMVELYLHSPIRPHGVELN
jgi:hypothetical protein